MTSFLQVCCAEPPTLSGLVERRVSWGPEMHSTDPRSFTIGALRLTEVALPSQLGRFLPASLRERRECLTIDLDVVVEWTNGRLEQAEAGVRDLFCVLVAERSEWAVIYEANRGRGSQVVRVAHGELFESVDAEIRRASDYDVTVFVPA